MPRLILIETSTSLCSTALVEGDEISCIRESTGLREHASKTAVFIKEMLDERGLKVSDCDAVCVSSGPGSYTGLRVGSSSAKGLCFGAGIPLIAIGTLDILAYQAVSERLVPDGCRTIVPMIDARRMEVYSAVYSLETAGALRAGRQFVRANPARHEMLRQQSAKDDSALSEIPRQQSAKDNPALSEALRQPVRTTEVKPTVVDDGSFKELLSAGPVLFIGDGAGKCHEVITSPNATFIQVCPNASAMLEPALSSWNEKRFENTAYFEPFYLKEFVATVSHKNIF